MPVATRNTELIDAIEATGKLSADRIRAMRRTDKRIYVGILELERRRQRIENRYGSASLDLICRGGNRHDLEKISDDPDEIVPEVVEAGIEEVRCCVRCAATVTEVRTAAGQRAKVPKYVCTDLYEAIKHAFTCAEASLLTRADRWENRLMVLAKKYKVGKAAIDQHLITRDHLTLLQRPA